MEWGNRNAEFGYVISDLGFGIADLQDGFLRFYPFKPLVKPHEQPRRKRRGIKQKILNAPRGGELNSRPPLAD